MHLLLTTLSCTCGWTVGPLPTDAVEQEILNHRGVHQLEEYCNSAA